MPTDKSDKKEDGRKFGKFLAELPVHERMRLSQANLKATEDEHKRFRSSFRGRHCYLCNKSLSSFYPELICLHWLLRPDGFKKDNLPLVASKYGYYQIQSYLRWVANEHRLLRNINELEDEGSGKKIFEVTIKYKKLEWAFSCGEGDYLGHESSDHAKHPHYHLQMRVNGQPFINYNDFHLPFNDEDIAYIESMKLYPDVIKKGFPYGEGINDVLTDKTIESIINSSIATDSAEDADFKIDTLVTADEGHSICGEEIHQIIEAAKKKGVTVASMLHQLPNATVKIIVSPGPSVVEQAPRSGRRKKRP